MTYRVRYDVARRSPRGVLLAAIMVVSVAGFVTPNAAIADQHPLVTYLDPDAETDVDAVTPIEFRVDVGDSQFDRIASWQVEVFRNGQSQGVLCRRAYGDEGPQRVTVTLAWDTAWYPGGDPPPPECYQSETLPTSERSSRHPSHNGEHTLRVTARTTGTFLRQAGTTNELRTVHLVNPPAVPSGLTTAFDEDQQSVELDWQSNPEPDIDAYLVEECRTPTETRACGPDAWALVAEVGPSATSAFVRIVEPGSYRYRVAARRPGRDAPIMSAWSPASEPITLADQTESDETDSTTGAPDGNGTDDDESNSSTTTTVSTTTTTAPPTSRGSSNLSVVSRPSTTPTTVDPGYSEVLPYRTDTTERSTTTRPNPGTAVAGGLSDGAGTGDLVLPVSLAGAMLSFVLALQVRYASRRPLELDPGSRSPAEER